MSITFGQIADRWQDLTRAVEQKQQKPEQFLRVYIGRIEAPSHQPIHGRRATDRSDYPPRSESFVLSEPLTGITLTRREIQVLYLICHGSTNQDASARMGLSVRTTEYYIKNMRRKVAANSKSSLIRKILATDFMERIDASVLMDDE